MRRPIIDASETMARSSVRDIALKVGGGATFRGWFVDAKGFLQIHEPDLAGVRAAALSRILMAAESCRAVTEGPMRCPPQCC
jgi:hypothetical protein